MLAAQVQVSKPLARYLCVTSAAVSNWKERVTGFPAMPDDKLATTIHDMVMKAIKGGQVEDIMDGTDSARLVHLVDGDPQFLFALIKKNSGKEEGDFAVVSIMTAEHVAKKRMSKWSSPNGLSQENKNQLMSVKAVPERKSSPAIQIPSAPVEEKKCFLVSYIPANRLPDNRVYEEYQSSSEVEERLVEIKAMPGSIRCWKQIAVGYRILDN